MSLRLVRLGFALLNAGAQHWRNMVQGRSNRAFVAEARAGLGTRASGECRPQGRQVSLSPMANQKCKVLRWMLPEYVSV